MNVPLDWLRMLRVELANRECWAEYQEITEGMAGSRLDSFTPTFRARAGVDTEAMAHLGRYLENVGPARARLEQFLADPNERIDP